MSNESQVSKMRPSDLASVRFFSIFNLCCFGIMILLFSSTAQGYFEMAFRFTLLVLPFFALPILLAAPAGYLADRFPKRIGILTGMLGEFLSIAIGAICFKQEIGLVSGIILCSCMFLSISLLQPSFYGLLPEIYREGELSRCNAKMTFWMFTGILAGTGFGILLYVLLNRSGLPMCWCFTICAGIALISFLRAFRLPLICQKTNKRYMKGIFRRGMQDVLKNPAHRLSTVGYALAFAFSIVLQLLLLLYGRESMGENSASTVILLQLFLLCGLLAGAMLAGRLSRHKIELGLIPFGTAGLAAGFILSAYCPGKPIDMMLSIPLLQETVAFQYFPLRSLWLLLGGISTGLLLVPLRSYCQQRYHEAIRGTALAINQATLSVFALIFILLTLLLQGEMVSRLFHVPETITSLLPTVSPSAMLAAFSIFAVLLTIYTMWMLPEFTLRFLCISFGRLSYKLQVSGAENIPTQGPALLVSNHVSLIDSILISSCTSRRVRFLMTEDFLKRPLIRVIAKLTGFIVVPSPSRGHKHMMKMLNTVRAALRNGEIICIFPEGQPTRNSVLREFKSGFVRMLPPELDIPMIPVCIGWMWGSRFSSYTSIMKHPLPLRQHSVASVSIGKPLPRNSVAYDFRQEISLLGTKVVEKNPFPGEMPLHSMLAYRVKKSPFSVLMRDADGKSFSTWKTFLVGLLFSRELRQLAEDDQNIGILMPNCTAAALAVLGVAYADMIPCQLNYTTPQPVFEKTLEKAGIHKIITSRKFLERIHITLKPEQCIYAEDLAKKITPWKTILMLAAILLLPIKEVLNLFSPLSNEDISRTATVLFSSGTTGNPKGVCLTHHNIYSDIRALADLICFDPQTDSFLGNLPLFHSFGLTVCFWIPVVSGAKVTFMPNPLDGDVAGKVIERDKITMLFATPSFLQTYMRKCRPEQLKSLRFTVTGAERLRPDIAKKFHDMTGKVITEGYGCTELSPVVSVNVPDDLADLGRIEGKAGSIGPSIAGVSTKVVDPITFKDLPFGSEGLLFVRGPIVMNGYLNDPEKTAQVMAGDYYNTGDVVTMDKSGRISICGRLSRFSKISGEMVPHEMVESIINELCGTGRRYVAVGGIPDKRKGEVLAVLYTPETSMTPDEIVAELRERSISNLWIPKAVNFYPVDALPLLGSGKLDLMNLKNILDKIAAEQQQAAGTAQA